MGQWLSSWFGNPVPTPTKREEEWKKNDVAPEGTRPPAIPVEPPASVPVPYNVPNDVSKLEIKGAVYKMGLSDHDTVPGDWAPKVLPQSIVAPAKIVPKAPWNPWMETSKYAADTVTSTKSGMSALTIRGSGFLPGITFKK